MLAPAAPSRIPLRCRCGSVRGVARDVSPAAGSRLVCYCADCQAFAHFLGPGEILDPAGGTDIFQMAPASIEVSDGIAQLRCVRLSAKGMFRWYAGCCRAPIGNMMAPGMAFIGLIDSFMDFAAEGSSREEVLGAPRWRIHGASATGPLPAGTHRGMAVGMIPRTVGLLVKWSVGGKKGGKPFFDREKKGAGAAVQVLTGAERGALKGTKRG